jgi:hemerythrin-like metal-binding protein
MRTLNWSISYASFVREIDDEHKEIFEELAEFQRLCAGGAKPPAVRKSAERLMTRLTDHFAHEERLMRAARYDSLKWHRKLHLAAKWRTESFVDRLLEGDPSAAEELVEYLADWLQGHTRVADRMMGASLRNHNLCKVTLQAGTRPLEEGKWVTATGEPFEPAARKRAT